MKETIVEFPERETPDMALIEEEAGAWLIKMDGDEPLGVEEREELREWILRSPVHKQELEDQAALWSNLNVMTELSVPLSGKREKSGWSSFFRPLVLFDWAKAPAAAGAFGVFAVVAATVFTLRGDPFLQSNGLYATEIGEQEFVTLADGSAIALNTNTQIAVDYTGEFRTIRMRRGEAHFDVAKDAKRPFRVYTDEGVFEAVGTAFSVRLTDENAAALVVTEGSVAVAALAEANARADASEEALTSLGLVTAGQGAAVERLDGEDDQSAINVIQDLDARVIERQLSWRQGYLTFSGEALSDAVQEISRYTALSIEIADPELGAVRIGGRVPLGETDGILNAFEANFGLEVTHAGPARILLSAAE